jgi:hypothetical protein
VDRPRAAASDPLAVRRAPPALALLAYVANAPPTVDERKPPATKGSGGSGGGRFPSGPAATIAPDRRAPMSSTVKPPRADRPEPGGLAHDDEMPRLAVSRRNLLVLILFVVLAVTFLYFVLPQLAGLNETWRRIERGDPWWLAAALAFTVLSFGGYVLLFEGIFARAGSPIDLRASYQITMAGLAATRP